MSTTETWFRGCECKGQCNCICDAYLDGIDEAFPDDGEERWQVLGYDPTADKRLHPEHLLVMRAGITEDEISQMETIREAFESSPAGGS